MANLVVFSGAGLSAESGLATFRGSGGLWNEHRISEVCSALTWRQNVRAVHDFYNARRLQAEQALPNAAHCALAAWQRRWNTRLLTQNVDGLLERAGAVDIVHLHGRLSEMRCEACLHVWTIEQRGWDVDGDTCPRCASPGAVCRPNVVFFHEDAPHYREMAGALNSLRDGDVVVVIGTSMEVIAFDRHLAVREGYKIVANLEPSRFGRGPFDLEIYGPATQTVDAVTQAIEQRLGPGLVS